ncbi:MAG: hypothetical protein AB7P76_01100 [Candidatus Melainabacteria bacterium]
MRKLFTLLSLLALSAQPLVAMAEETPAPGEEPTAEAKECPVCWEKGEYTTAKPVESRIMTTPLRVVTGAAGAPVGAVYGMGKGTAESVSWVARNTFGNLDAKNSKDPFVDAAAVIMKAPFLIPAGVVGTLFAIPVGAVGGTVAGTGYGTAKGYMFPDKL